MLFLKKGFEDIQVRHNFKLSKDSVQLMTSIIDFNIPRMVKNPGDAVVWLEQPVEFPGKSNIEPVDMKTLLAKISTMPPPPPADPFSQTG